MDARFKVQTKKEKKRKYIFLTICWLYEIHILNSKSLLGDDNGDQKEMDLCLLTYILVFTSIEDR